jgi:hypothetical protein
MVRDASPIPVVLDIPRTIRDSARKVFRRGSASRRDKSGTENQFAETLAVCADAANFLVIHGPKELKDTHQLHFIFCRDHSPAPMFSAGNGRRSSRFSLSISDCAILFATRTLVPNSRLAVKFKTRMAREGAPRWAFRAVREKFIVPWLSTHAFHLHQYSV